MLRTAVALVCVALFIAAAQESASQEKDGFVPLIKESDLSDWEGNTNAGWTLENGTLRGRADGRSPALLMLKDHDPGDFELRFEALIHKGSVRSQMMVTWSFCAVRPACFQPAVGPPPKATLIHKGSVRVKMRGPGPGPLGIAVEINPDKVELVTNGSSFFIAASNRPDEWNEYRVVFRGLNLKLWKNGIPAPYELGGSHVEEKGRLSLHLSDHEASDVSLRRLRIKE
jgi:hypothetical protein